MESQTDSDNEKRQQISESEPKSNDSSKKKSRRHWTCCDLIWFCDMLLAQFLLSGLWLISFLRSLGSALKNLLRWVFQKKKGSSDPDKDMVAMHGSSVSVSQIHGDVDGQQSG